MRDFKRMFAFSTVEHMGIILVAVGLGGSEAHLGAAYQMTGHAIAKSFCFFAAGIDRVLVIGTQEIADVRGLVRLVAGAASPSSPGGFAIAGAPPFAVFVSELRDLESRDRQRPVSDAVGLLAVFIVVAFCAVMLHVDRMAFGMPSRTARPLPPPPLPAS